MNEGGRTWTTTEVEMAVKKTTHDLNLTLPKSVCTKYMRIKNAFKATGAVPGEVVKFPVTVNQGGGTRALGNGEFGNYFYRSITKWLKKVGSDPEVRTRWQEDRFLNEENFMWARVNTERIHSHPMNGTRARNMESKVDGPIIYLELYTDGVAHGKSCIRARVDSKVVHVYAAVR